MRLTIVRQDYRPDGSVERVTERALEALLERNVAVSLYTRSWPQTRLQLVEPLVCRSVPRRRALARLELRARRVPRRAALAAEPRRVARAPALLRHLPRERRRARRVARGAARGTRRRPGASRAKLSPYNRYLLAMEKRLYAIHVAARGDLQFEDGQGRDPPPLSRLPESKLHVIYNPVDSEVFHPGLRDGARGDPRAPWHRRRRDGLPRGRGRSRARRRGHRDRCARASCAPPAHLIVIGRRATLRARYRARARARGVGDRVTFVGCRRRPAAVLRRRRRVRAAVALRSVAGRRARGDGLRRCR